MGVCALRMHLENLLVLNNRLIRTACAQKSAREVILRFFLVGDNCEARGVPGNGTIEIPFGYKDICKIAGGFGVVRPNFERLLVMGNGIISTPDSKKRHPEIVFCCRISGIDRSSSFVVANCVVKLTSLNQEPSQVIMCLRVLRPQAN